MSIIVIGNINFEVITCGACGISFAVPEHWVDARRADHRAFKCPNGDGRAFYGESVAERATREKRELEQCLQAQLNEAKHAKLVAERARDKAIKDKRKVERRIAHGVCPCCNKTFADIANHMLTEHKDFRLPAGKPTKQIAGAA